jgi:hypothetical protein
LGVDFGNKTFNTNLNLSAQGAGVQSFAQSGTLNPSTGIFLSNSPAGNANAGNVAGAITFDARQAGFLFRAPVTPGATGATSLGAGTFSGATLWGR